MYEETACSDPNSMSAEPTPPVVPDASQNGFPQTMAHIPALPSFPPPPPLIVAGGQDTHANFDDNNLNLSMEEISYHHHHRSGGGGDAMELEFQQQGVGFDNCNMNPSFGQEVSSDSNRMVCLDQSAWVGSQIQEMGFNHHLIQSQDHQFSDSAMAAAYTQAPDLLNFFNMPAARCSNNSSISFSNNTISNLHSSAMGGFLADLPAGDGSNPSSTSLSILYDPLFHLNLPPQPPLFRELFHSLPHGYGLPAASSRGRGGSLFPEGEIMEREGTAGVYEDGDGSGVLEFSRDMADCIGKGRDGKMTKHFATERQRRVQLNDKYKALRSLVPSPTKTDRASIVGDAINYIKELLREVKELKLLVEKKRCSRERSKRHRTAEEDGGAWDVESSNAKTGAVGDGGEDQSYNLRSSWLQRKTKDTEVDVRIVDDEVTIKLVQRKLNCLLLVSKLLDDLQLDLHHVAGGHIGDYYSFLFNTKIYEGSSVYASAIANKVMEAVDRQYNNTNNTANTSITPHTNTY
ncbi:transcription factor bHLH91-like [Cucurbita moschata]|uniref:Transcription factor bHLH91-like n=1 Tax=Cucurbita moschata TaxID=3662 RepID=A0A6J1H2Y8_CUCMO|nr:transcription factor bHLH91-like [Cucurbita moschata]XP_022958756.1 transcription factor bHLH91-like [Cucurbita moschata]